jgi:proteasome lid subunit RPN8/RPN11
MQLSQHTAERILKLCAEQPTVEVTGFVSRSKEGSDELVVPMANTSSTPETDYVWSPPEMMARYHEMDARGHLPIAMYHSHPGGKSDPSEVDMTSAFQEDMVYLIAYPTQEQVSVPQLRAGMPEPACADYRTVWKLSAWLCLEQGVLIGEPLDLL